MTTNAAQTPMGQGAEVATTQGGQTTHDCECQNWDVETDTANPETGEGYLDTGCAASTTRQFAPGHDAKLKSLLITAGTHGWSVSRLTGGVRTSSTPVEAASYFGFEHQVAAGIKNGQDKLFARQLREANREAKKANAAKKAAKVPEKPESVKAKVGRWVYEGFVATDGTGFHYADAKGEHKTTHKYTIQ